MPEVFDAISRLPAAFAVGENEMKETVINLILAFVRDYNTHPE
jgi:hypothetical protein